MYLVWLVVYDLLYFRESQTRAWTGKFVSQRFWLNVIGAGQRFGGCVESSLACAYHTRRHQFPPYHRRHHHRCNNPWKLQWYLGVPSASSCIAETHQTRCMSLRTCTCKWPTGPRTRAYQILRPPTSCFFGFRRYIRHILSRRAPANPSRAQPRPPSAFVCYI